MAALLQFLRDHDIVNRFMFCPPTPPLYQAGDYDTLLAWLGPTQTGC